MIDNIDKIKSLLNFESEGDFYMLYVLKRKKDQPESERDNHQSVRTIKTYAISSLEYLDKRYEEIKMLCEVFKARGYIHVQRQNHRDISLSMLVELAHRIKDGIIHQKGLFDSVVGQIPTTEKRWIVDLDTKEVAVINQIISFLDGLAPIGVPKLIAEIPTKNGVHLITNKFDLNSFSKVYPSIDVQKKNPTLLYYPNSLDNG